MRIEMNFFIALNHATLACVVYFMLNISSIFGLNHANTWNVTFDPKKITELSMLDTISVHFKFSFNDISPTFDIKNATIIFNTSNSHVLECIPFSLSVKNLSDTDQLYTGSFNVKGKFLGRAEVQLIMQDSAPPDEKTIYMSPPLEVVVIRPERLIDTIFMVSVITLVSIIFVNFGCALEWTNLRQNLKRPVSPLVGLFSHFFFMPIISFGLGQLLFPDSSSMQLGLFFTGVSPGGEASNIWIYMMGGNINLSITVTTLVTITSFAMIPLWLFTVGHLLFSDAKMTVPYKRICPLVFSLLIPLSIGYYIQRRHPRLCVWMVKILKPFSACLILFIIIFASLTNLYLFELFTWRIILAGMGLPWLGYICGGLFSKLCCLPTKDVIAIAIETGIQNTGISIFMLKLSLGRPEADLTTVVPVAVASMSPIPLLIWLLIRKFFFAKREEVITSREDTSREKLHANATSDPIVAT